MKQLFKNKNWLVIDKPCGISTHGAWDGDLAVQEWLQLHRAEETFVCSRLDKGTSGVLLFARNAESSALAQQIHEKNEAQKVYFFLSDKDSQKVFGKSEWKCDLPLDGKECQTLFLRVGKKDHLYLYQASIFRGRTHQIRRHAQSFGLTIAGDSEYGGVFFPRLALHCQSVNWPGQGDPWLSELPQSFENPAGVCGEPGIYISSESRGNFYENICSAFRCLHRGELQKFDIAVDKYADWLCVWSYDETMPDNELVNQITPLVNVLMNRYKCDGWVLKRARKNPHGRGLIAIQLLFGNPPPPWFEVVEHGIKYRVTLTESQHVGLFLDQRDNRRRVALESAQKRVANLFSYTCSFSLAAAVGGAEVVFSVDIAKPCLDIGKLNFASAGLAQSGQGKFIQEDARDWLKRQVRKLTADSNAPKLDLIVCDPPTFASTSGKEFSVEESWNELAAQSAFLLSANGVAYFSTNHRGGTAEKYQKILENHFSKVTKLSNPIDFPESSNAPLHVKLFKCAMK